MDRINNSGWPALIGKNVRDMDGIVHRIADAYGLRDGVGRIYEECARSAAHWEMVDNVPVTDETVTCFACIAGAEK